MKLIGLMSGTSVDGIDAVLVEIGGDVRSEPLHWQVESALCEAWTPELRAEILRVCQPDAPLQRVVALDGRLGEVFGDVANRLMYRANVKPEDIGAICSHGQTIWHQPEPFALGDGSRVCGTLQIGEGAVIAERTGCRVVSDFRVADMAAGGQGAPLVPFVDALLFRHPDETRVVQNIGGIANLTYLPSLVSNESVFAFDTGPGNMIVERLDFTSRRTAKKPLIETGGIAAQGTVCTEWLDQLLTDTFFAQIPPKSTGRETFGAAYAERFEGVADRLKLSFKDRIATATALTAHSIADSYHQFLPTMPRTVIVGGGGVHNATLMAMLCDCLPDCALKTHADFGIGDDSKEALAFAILGYHTLLGLPSNLPSATGAKHPAILGKINYPPPNFHHPLR